MKEKTLDITSSENSSDDIKTFGDPDIWKCICKASNDKEGWMKSTKAMQVENGCIIQVTTQQRNPDGSYAIAESVCYVPHAMIVPMETKPRKLTPPKYEKPDNV